MVGCSRISSHFGPYELGASSSPKTKETLLTYSGGMSRWWRAAQRTPARRLQYILSIRRSTMTNPVDLIEVFVCDAPFKGAVTRDRLTANLGARLVRGPQEALGHFGMVSRQKVDRFDQ